MARKLTESFPRRIRKAENSPLFPPLLLPPLFLPIPSERFVFLEEICEILIIQTKPHYCRESVFPTFDPFSNGIDFHTKVTLIPVEFTLFQDIHSL